MALDDVSVEIPSGSLTALLGPSGGGKSTLLRVMAGLEPPDSGVVELDGVDATSLPPQRRNVGFVFQHYAAFKHLSVYRNVAFGLEIRKRPKDEIRRRVDRAVGAGPPGGSSPTGCPPQLSGGQRQRMALARALAVEPSILLLDEPFGALDAQVRKELRNWLRRLHDQIHVTTVFVTHDQEEAMDVADRIVVMANARVEQIGTPDELYDQPANPFVMSFLGPVTELDGRLVRPHDLELVDAPAPRRCPWWSSGWPGSGSRSASTCAWSTMFPHRRARRSPGSTPSRASPTCTSRSPVTPPSGSGWCPGWWCTCVPPGARSPCRSITGADRRPRSSFRPASAPNPTRVVARARPRVGAEPGPGRPEYR